MHCIMGPATAGRSENTQRWYRKEVMHSPLGSDSPELEPRLHVLETSQINVTSPTLVFSDPGLATTLLLPAPGSTINLPQIILI